MIEPAFTVTPGWIPYHPSPSRPAFRPPAGAVDAHCHVFGPGARFPYAPERKHTPCDASKEQLWALRDFLGFSRNVIVQATCHGADNRALLDALDDSKGRARGVATVKRSITDDELDRLHAAGVRGVRVNFVKRLVDRLPREELTEIAHRIDRLGWHVVIYFEAQELPELYDFFAGLPTPVVVDHMGRPDIAWAPTARTSLSSSMCCDHAATFGARPPARNGSRSRDLTPMTTSSPSHAASSKSFPIACSGAPIGRIQT